ncbi:hypothetical protein TsFJ059_006198 [Trichoderma semiorbis]|uniref:Uncharacterized protein n=1 Tax=Trichoderma semiorbis TaxID=1491008 RepID=A0A9P8KKF1_9HYPO|nr:hypothetical protein TsFJ059_006198 [Trichoderma semiorbis]
MGLWKPIAKLEVKLETWRWRSGYGLLERTPAEPEWWEVVMEREKRRRKEERRIAKEERRAAKEERRAAKEQRRRERQSQKREFDWRDYIPRFPKVVGYTPLWKLDEMLASPQGVRW